MSILSRDTPSLPNPFLQLDSIFTAPPSRERGPSRTTSWPSSSRSCHNSSILAAALVQWPSRRIVPAADSAGIWPAPHIPRRSASARLSPVPRHGCAVSSRWPTRPFPPILPIRPCRPLGDSPATLAPGTTAVHYADAAAAHRLRIGYWWKCSSALSSCSPTTSCFAEALDGRHCFPGIETAE